MSEGHAAGPAPPIATRARRIDEVCDRFEAAWRAGRAPRIEDYLGDEVSPDRADLLGELLALELQLRRRRGERPEAAEYRARFPDAAAPIRAAFDAARPAAAGAEPRPAPGARRADAGRDLLFGLLALQNDFVGRDALVAAFRAWVADKGRPLGRILLERGDLDPARHGLLEALVGEHLKLHGGDPERSLATLDLSESTRRGLQAIADPDVQATLVHVGAHGPGGDGPPRGGATGPPGPGPASRFRILRPHAQGGLGVVFVAEDEELHREVALKEIRDHLADDPRSRARFVLEAEITGSLEHPGIAPVYGLGRYADGRPFYAMRFIKGESLKEAIQAFHRVDGPTRDPGERALALRHLLGQFVAVCNTIAYAHSRGVLHRDLKPANVMLGRFGETFVVDWGLARPIGRAIEADATPEEEPFRPSAGAGSILTRGGSGTPQYMSPEQAAGRLDLLGPASDVYSLGATLYVLLAGRPALEDRDLGRVLERLRRGDFPPPRRVNPRVPPALQAVCLKAMALDPAERYASAQALADDLEHWLADEPVSAWREPVAARARRWLARHRTVVTTGVAALMVVTIASVALAVLVDHARRRADRLAAELATDRALSLCEQREVGHGMLGLVRALELADAARDEPLRRAIRRNLAAWRSRLATLRAILPHPAEVRDLALGPDGRVAVTGGGDGVARLWDLEAARPLGRPLVHDKPIRTVAFRPDGRAVATGGEDGVARLWDATTGEPLGPPIRHPLPVTRVAFRPDGRALLVASGARAARLWDATTGEPLGPPLRHEDMVWAAAFSPDGRTIVTGGSDHTARAWDAATGKPLGAPLEHPSWVGFAAFSPDGKLFLTLGSDATARLWDAATLRPHGRPLEHAANVWSAAFSPDGRAVLTGSGDATARLWDAATCRPIGVPMRHGGPVRVVTFAPDGKVALTSSEDTKVRLWDAATGEPLGAPLVHGSLAPAVAFRPDGRSLVTAGMDRAARLWDVSGLRPGAARAAREPGRLAAAFAPGGRSLAAIDGPKSARLYDAATGEPLGAAATLDRHQHALAVAAAPDGRTLLIGSGVLDDGEARLWDAAAGTPRPFRLKHRGPVWAVAFGPGGRTALTGGEDRVGRLWDVATGRPLAALSGHADAIVAVAVGPGDGRTLLTGGADHTARLWDAATGRPIGEPLTHRGAVLAVAFSPDGRTALTGGADATARLWDAATGKPIGAPMGHVGVVRSAAFSPDGRTVVTGGADATARLWDAATGKPIGPPAELPGPALAVGFAPGGRDALAACPDRSVRRWPVPAPLGLGSGQVRRWARVITGMDLDRADGLHAIAVPDWLDAHAALRAAGTPP